MMGVSSLSTSFKGYNISSAFNSTTWLNTSYIAATRQPWWVRVAAGHRYGDDREVTAVGGDRFLANYLRLRCSGRENKWFTYTKSLRGGSFCSTFDQHSTDDWCLAGTPAAGHLSLLPLPLPPTNQPTHQPAYKQTLMSLLCLFLLIHFILRGLIIVSFVNMFEEAHDYIHTHTNLFPCSLLYNKPYPIAGTHPS